MVHASDASAKIILRLEMRGLRRRLCAEAPDAAEQAASHLPPALLANSRIVAGYRPLGAEIDPWPLMAAFAQAGAQIALPVALSLDAPLVFRAYADGDQLEPDATGIASPTANAPELEPDLVVTPLLAFDRLGARMGHGGGHYDRTLQALRRSGWVFALGLAYAGQEVARIPAEAHDQPLDAILTEKEYIEVAKDL
jgi:5-formyltetrahydrofolate cyclo-ligase